MNFYGHRPSFYRIGRVFMSIQTPEYLFGVRYCKLIQPTPHFSVCLRLLQNIQEVCKSQVSNQSVSVLQYLAAGFKTSKTAPRPHGKPHPAHRSAEAGLLVATRLRCGEDTTSGSRKNGRRHREGGERPNVFFFGVFEDTNATLAVESILQVNIGMSTGGTEEGRGFWAVACSHVWSDFGIWCLVVGPVGLSWTFYFCLYLQHV